MTLAVALDISAEMDADRFGLTVTAVKSALPCRTFDPDLWFADAPAELELAKSLCGDCPVQAECLAGAIERGEPWGVWGGEIFERGVVIARKRPRGRPRKDALVQDASIQTKTSVKAAALAVTRSVA